MIDPSVKQDLREIGKKLTNLRGLFDLDLKQEMIENFEEKMSAPTSGMTMRRRKPSLPR